MTGQLDLETLRVESSLERSWVDWTGFVPLTAGEDSRLPKLRLAGGSSVDIPAFARTHTFTGPVQALGCFFLRDIHVAGLLYPFKDGELLDDDTHLSRVNHAWLAHYPTHNPGKLIDRCVVRIHSPVIPVAGPGVATFGHWIVDFLPRLAVAQAVLGDRFRSVKFLILHNTPSWAMQLLSTFFGIGESDCIRLELGNEEFVCARLIYPTYAHSFPFLLHSFVPKFYRKHFTPPGGARKLCVGRQGTTNRAFRRRQDFEQMAIAKGYELIDPADFTITEQAEMFGSASVIIGEYGSGLHNSVFSPSDTILGILNAPGVEQTRLCAAFGQPILFMPGLLEDNFWSLSDEQFASFFAALADMEAEQAEQRQISARVLVERPEQIEKDEHRLRHGPFLLETADGTIVKVASSTGAMVLAVPDGEPSSPLLLYIPSWRKDVAFAFPASGPAEVTIAEDMVRATAIPFRLERDRDSIVVSLRHTLSRRYIRTGPLPGEGQPHSISIGATEPELFTLRPMLSAPPDPAVARTMAEIEALGVAVRDGPTLLRTFLERSKDDNSGLLTAGTLLLPEEQLAWLGGQIRTRVEIIGALARIFPEDPYVLHVLPELVGLRDGGSKLLDLPRRMTAPRLLNRYARRADPPVGGVCIAAVAYDVAGSILDWIAHHRSIGAEQIFLYCQCDDPKRPLYDALHTAGYVHLVVTQTETREDYTRLCFDHIRDVCPEILRYTWTMFIECEDYVLYDRQRFRLLPDFFAWHNSQRSGSVAFNLRVFGSQGAREWSEFPAPRRFKARLARSDDRFRLAFRNDLSNELAYAPTARADGSPHRPQPADPGRSANPHSAVAWINCYPFQSADQMLWESADESRSPLTSRAADRLAEFLKQQQDVVADDRAMLDFDTAKDRTKADILKTPAIAEAADAVIAQFRAELAALKQAGRAMRMTRVSSQTLTKLLAYLD